MGRLRGATIAITDRLRLGRPELEKLSDLKLIAVAGTGFDQIDIAAYRERGIVVSNLRGWCDCSVAEHVFALALALRRNLSEQGRIASGTAWHHTVAGHCIARIPHEIFAATPWESWGSEGSASE